MALVVPLLVVATAATFDMGWAYVTRNKLQATADAAALAGASALPDQDEVGIRAIAAAQANMSVGGHGNVLIGGDIETGNWDSESRTFTASGTPLNAVRVVTRRAAANGNPLDSIFAAVVGIMTFDISTPAVAVNAGGEIDDCLRNGFLANGKLEVGSNVTVQGDTCVHGEEGIKVSSNVTMNGGADVTYGPGSSFEGRNNSGNNIPSASQESKAFPVDIDSIIDTFTANPSAAPQPDWGPWDAPDPPINGDWKPNAAQCAALNGSKKLIRVTGKVELTDCSTSTLMHEFAVYAGKEIILPSGSSSPNQFKMRDMYFASNDFINVGSNVDIGGSNFCNDGLGSSFFIARNRIILQSDIRMWGVQLISGSSSPGDPYSYGVEMGDDLETLATAVWSAGFLKLGSNPNLNGGTESASCDRDEHILTHSGNMALRLVD